MEQVKDKAGVKDKAPFSLPKMVVRIEFIKQQKGSITNTKHVLYGGMAELAKRRLVPRRNQVNFKYISILTEEEQAFLEPMLSLEKGGLSIYKTEGNYWDGMYVDLFKEGINLDLSDPIEYIKYKIVLSYDDLVCPSLAQQKLAFKQTYKFVVVKPGEKGNEKVSVYNLKKEAYAIATKLELNMQHVREFLYLANIRSTSDASISWLKEKLSEMVEEKPQLVIDLHTSADYETRALISRGVLAGVIRDTNGKYSLEDGLQLCAEGEMATLANAIKFLASGANSDVKLLIEAKLGK